MLQITKLSFTIALISTCVTSSPTPANNDIAALFEKVVTKLGNPIRRNRVTPRKHSLSNLVRLVVEYLGSNRRVQGCQAVVIHSKWLLVPRTCVTGHVSLRETTADGVPLRAIYMAKGGVGEIAVIELTKSLGNKKIAPLATKSSNHLVLIESQNEPREYRVQSPRFCNKVGGSRGSASDGSNIVCATPKTDTNRLCPVVRGAIAFESAKPDSSLVGFGLGGDCVSSGEQNVSWIALVAQYRNDILNLIAGKPSKFVKKSNR